VTLRRSPLAPEVSRPAKRNQGDSAGSQGLFCLPLSAVSTLPADTPLFTVPAGLLRILNRDLKAAGIPKRDERGRTVDVHALRTTFGTLLSKAGVAPRTAQAAMRHSTINLTMNVYTDPKLLDVAGAVESLPSLPLRNGPQTVPNVVTATGTDDSRACLLVPTLVPTAGKPSTPGAIPLKTAGTPAEDRKAGTIAPSACVDKRKDPLTTVVNGSCEWAALDSNQRLLPCEDSALTN
jgi:hypothetical protein